MKTIEIKPIQVDHAATETQIKFYEDECLSVAVTNQTQYEDCINWIRQIENFKKDLDEKRKTITKPIDQAKKAVMDLFNPYIEKCEKFSSFLRSKANGYLYEQEQLRIAEQKKAFDEAEKKRKELEAKAKSASENGNEAKAEKLLEKADNIQVAVVAPTVESVAGTAKVTRWKHRIIDETLIPREYLIVNEQALSKVAIAMKGTLKIPGVEFYSETTLAVKK